MRGVKISIFPDSGKFLGSSYIFMEDEDFSQLRRLQRVFATNVGKATNQMGWKRCRISENMDYTWEEHGEG